MNFTPLLRTWFVRHAQAGEFPSAAQIEKTQRRVLDRLLREAAGTAYGRRYGFGDISAAKDPVRSFCERVPAVGYEDIRGDVMKMVAGTPDILWPGVTRRFAQSSGTSGGKSKYIPITRTSLSRNHYAGGRDVVAHYLNLYPDSRIFAGKSFILGGSFANEIEGLKPGVKVGDLSANLIENINPVANLVRVPDKKTALMADWNEKLPALVEASLKEDITNISGVPSWFMTVIERVIERAGASTIHDVWPNLEVFFHGGISFGPYRKQYERLTDPTKMRYLETYNASEGFFAVQDCRESRGMLLLLDAGVFYEFIPLSEADEPYPRTLKAWEVEQGQTYALLITSCNGLWRYAIGDTVKIETAAPLRITIAGRTQHYINAFGEELMVYNADAALAAACRRCDCEAANYTAAPVFAADGRRGRHEWLIEWNKAPESSENFADVLDAELQKQNSDYQAKRAGGIFLDRLSITEAPCGTFDAWLASTGKLGGQRKIPRLANDRRFIDPIKNMMKQ